MFLHPKTCPNSECINHLKPLKEWFKKNGTFKKENRKIPRYICKSCGLSFSTSTLKPTYQQHKPEINEELFKLLVSGVSLRRSSQILEVEYNTILLHFDYLAGQAKKQHFKHLKTIHSSYVQVDEMETFLHAKAKALSVALIVMCNTGEILGFKVARMPSKGLLASLGQSKYQWTTDERATKFQSLLMDLKPCLTSNILFKSDMSGSYHKWIKNILPTAQIEQVVGIDTHPSLK